MKTIKKIVTFIRKSPLESGAGILAIVAVLIGGYALVATQAAGPFAFADAANGTLAGGAKVISDSDTPTGKAIQFAQPAPAPTPTPTPEPTPTPTPTPTPPAPASPRNKLLYQDKQLANAGRPAAISGQPYAIWIGGWSGDPKTATKAATDAAASQGKIPVFVLYNIPLRDCGLYSAGGLKNFTEYRNWINGITQGIGQREAIVIIEPDALAAIDCLNATQKADRLNGLADAVDQLTSKTKSFVYIDAGNVSWIPAGEMANRLKQVGIDKARGFALNTSNFFRISENINYGTAISNNVGKKPFVVDTSRNGQGVYTNPNDPEAWCNPPGRGLGVRPTTTTQQALVDAYLWVKTPGESDGACKGAPAAGQWFESYAQELIRNANYNVQ